MSILHPLECYFIEQIMSIESYEKRYREFKAAMDVAETRYLEVMRHIPIDFRSRPVNQQLDVTWGSTVLPNLRRTLKLLESDYLYRLNNNLSAYPSGGAMESDLKGMHADMGVDFSWMGMEAEQRFDLHFNLANGIDSNIRRSTTTTWTEGYLTYGLDPNNRHSNFGLTLPTRIPRYELVPDEVVKIGKKPRITGLYLPSVPHAAASFLYPHANDYTMQAMQGQELQRYVDEDTGKVFYYWEKRDMVPTEWTLIRRVDGEYLDVPPEGFFPNHHPQELYHWPEREKQYLSEQAQPRIAAWSGETCPHSGRWSTFMYRGVEFTHFEQGQQIPEWLDKYGAPQKAQWTLLERDDGGSPLIKHIDRQ